MKHAIKHILFINLFVILFAEIACGENVTFTKEYTYQASEFDSKASSRILALEQIKKLLLEELGTYLISETEVKNYQLTKDQVTVFTAGIVRTEVIEEKWDGKIYQLKARLSADPEEVARSVEKLRQDKKTSKELTDTKKRADDLEKEVVKLRQELTVKADGGKIKQYNDTVNKLSAIDWMQRSLILLGDGKDVNKNKEALEAINKALELSFENPEFYFIRARILYYYLDSKDYRQILSDLDKAITLTPSDKNAPDYKITAEYHSMKAKIYRDKGEWRNVIKELETAIIMDPDNAIDSYEVFPDKPASDKDWSKKNFNTIISKIPKDYRSYLLRGYFNKLFTKWHPHSTTPQYYNLAIADYNNAIKLNPKSSLVYYLLGRIYSSKAFWVSASPREELENNKKAIDSLSKAIRQNNSCLDAYRWRAGSYATLKEYKKAINDYNKILEFDPESESIYYDRGRAYQELRQYADAVQSFTRAIDAKKHDAMLLPYNNYVARAEVYSMTGKFEKSLADYTKAIELREVFIDKVNKANLNKQGYDSITSDLYNGRGRVYSLVCILKSVEASKNTNKHSSNELIECRNAISDSTQAIKLYSKSTAYETRADAYLEIKDYKNALQDLDMSIWQYKEANINSGQLYIKRANVYVGIENFKQAVSDYSQAIEYSQQPDWAGPMNLEYLFEARGSAYSAIEENKKAIQDFSEAIKRSPQYTAAFINRGVAYANLSNYKAALADFDVAVTLSPQEGIAYFNRGLTRINLKDHKRGIEDYKIAARLGYKNAQDKLQELQIEW
jgi:tetratricopeptide (TPR) repeat protein